MPVFSTYLRTGMSSLTDGSAADAGVGQRWEITYTGTVPVEGDSFTFTIIDSEAGTQSVFGAGDTAGISPTFCKTLGNKVYMLAGSTVFFSEVADPTVFNDPEGTGNGFVNMANQVQTPEDLVALVPFQGRLAFMSRTSTQLWNIAADPAGWSQVHVLENVGCLAKNSVQPTGHLDALFLSDTGIRALRSREVTLNAFVDDIGSPIDALVRAAILAYPAEAAAACSVVDPGTGQYWCFLKDTIYVLSQFPSSKVVAWSTFEPKDSNGTTFAPDKFLVFGGQIYAFDASVKKIYRYGGVDNNTYDATQVEVELPWMDFGRRSTEKRGHGVQVAASGHWNVAVQASPDLPIEAEVPVWNYVDTTVDKGRIPFADVGTHMRARMVSVGSGKHVFSSLAISYSNGREL